jgi:hypothetical protein
LNDGDGNAEVLIRLAARAGLALDRGKANARSNERASLLDIPIEKCVPFSMVRETLSVRS